MRSPSPFVAAFCRSDSIATIAAAAGLSVVLAALPAFAVDPARPFGNFVSTHFTANDGLPGGVVDDILETRDGFLWLIVNGQWLVRFDGQNFHWFEEIRLSSFALAPNGDLWLGTREGVRQIPSDRLRDSDLSSAVSHQQGSGAASQVGCLRFDRDGVLWAGTGDGLYRFDNGRFRPVGPRVPILHIELAANGHVWLITKDGLIELDGSVVLSDAEITTQLEVKASEIFQVKEDSHGNVWYSCARGVARRSGARWQKFSAYGLERHAAYQTYEDPQGNVWVVENEGLFRATAEELEPLPFKMKVRALYGDHDGNLWVGTDGDGLYRFKDPLFRMFTRADGLPNDVIMTVLAARDGSIWTGANCGGLTRFDGSHFHTYDEKDGLLNSCVWTLAEGVDGDLWIGTWGGGAFHLHAGRFTQVLPEEVVTCIAAARDGSFWFATRRGLARLQDRNLRMYTKADGLASDRILRVFEDASGRILAATAKSMHILVGDRFESFPQIPDSLAVPMGEDRSGGLFVSLDREPYTIRIEGSRIEALPELGRTDTLVESDAGDLWLGGYWLLRVAPNSFTWPRPPDEPLNREQFGTPDGLATEEFSAGWPKMVFDGDGKLWIATPLGLAMLDPQRLTRATRAPTIYVREVTVGRETRPAPRELFLPVGTSHVEIDFGAVETTSPEKVPMQYRLEGVDAEWLDAGTQFRAIYSNIPPGPHALRLRARNRSGIWDRAGVTYLITQQPHFYQTRWFLALTIGIGLSAIGGAYRLRVRQVARRLSARFDERLAERTRVAREIHDTFLQTVQGSKLVVDHALKDPDDHARLLRAVKQLAGWLERAIEEGRAALNSLRVSATETNDLAEAFRRAIDECRAETRLDATLSITGDARALHPVVRDEVYRIGYEAIRNACTHSGGDVLKVKLGHDHDFTLQVLDNGAGMDPALSESGKAGHFGLRGMRERAERIGGKLTIASSPGAGTTVTVAVPGRLAYRTKRSHLS